MGVLEDMTPYAENTDDESPRNLVVIQLLDSNGVIGPVTAVYGVTQLPRIGIVTVVGWFQSVI